MRLIAAIVFAAKANLGPGTRYWGEHIFVHEFAHAIMGGGIRDVDAKMFAEIRAAYDSAMAAGKYVHTDGRKH